MSPLARFSATHGDNQIGLWRPSFTRYRHLLYAFGGGGVVNNHLHVLDLRTACWRTLATAHGTSPTKRYGHTASRYKDSIVVFGGSSEAQMYCKDVVVFDLVRNEWWRPKVTEQPGPGMGVNARYLHTATVYDDHLYVYGGFARNSECTYVLDQMSVLCLTTWTWSAPVQVPARYNHSATLVGDSMYIYAGKDESGRTVPDLFKVHLPTKKLLPQRGLGGDVALLKSQHFTEMVDGSKLVMFGKFVTQQQLQAQQDGEDAQMTVGAAPSDDNAYGLWMLDLDTLDWQQLSRDKVLPPPSDNGTPTSVWNYFTTVPVSEVYGGDGGDVDEDEDVDLISPSGFSSGAPCNTPALSQHRLSSPEQDERCLFVLLGNTEHARPQPYDHFRDLLIIDPESVGLWQTPRSTIREDLSRMLLDDEPRQWADFCLYPCPDDDAISADVDDGEEVDGDIAGGRGEKDSTRPTRGTPVRVHRSVLWSRWPHFRRLLSSGMQELTRGGLQLDEPREVVEVFVWYLYTDLLDPKCGKHLSTARTSNEYEAVEVRVELETRIICGVLVLANLYLLPRLAKLCAAHLADHGLAPRTAGAVFQSAVESNELGLKQLAMEYIFSNYGAVIRAQGLEGMSRLAMGEFLSGVPECATLSINTGGAKMGITGMTRNSGGARRVGIRHGRTGSRQTGSGYDVD